MICCVYNPAVGTVDDYKGLEIYTFSTDSSGELITKVNEEAEAYICAVTKNYFIVYIEYGAKVYLCAVEME